MRMVIEVPEDLHTRFKDQTKRLGLSQAAVVRNLVDSWLLDPNQANMGLKRAAKPSEAPANAPERQRRRDEILRKARKGK